MHVTPDTAYDGAHVVLERIWPNKPTTHIQGHLVDSENPYCFSIIEDDTGKRYGVFSWNPEGMCEQTVTLID